MYFNAVKYVEFRCFVFFLFAIKGYFLLANSNLVDGTGEAFEHVVVTKNSIALASSKLFKLSLWSFFYCEGTREDCSRAGDFIAIHIGKDLNSFIEIYRNGSDFGRYQDKQWTREEVFFNYTDDQIYVSSLSIIDSVLIRLIYLQFLFKIQIELKRVTTVQSTQAYLCLDNIEISSSENN